MEGNEAPPAAPPKEKWFHHIWFVVAMLLAAGPFAFPLLWKSSQFSRGAKWVLTILFILLTIAAIWLSVESVKLVLKQFQELRATLL